MATQSLLNKLSVEQLKHVVEEFAQVPQGEVHASHKSFIVLAKRPLGQLSTH